MILRITKDYWEIDENKASFNIAYKVYCMILNGFLFANPISTYNTYHHPHIKRYKIIGNKENYDAGNKMFLSKNLAHSG